VNTEKRKPRVPKRNRILYMTPAAMKLLFDPAVMLALLRYRAVMAWRELTGQTKKPGIRDLQNTWLAEVEYMKINAMDQISKLKTYTFMGEEDEQLLLRIYSKRQRWGQQIKEYLEELTYDEEGITEPPKQFFHGTKITRTHQGRDQGEEAGNGEDKQVKQPEASQIQRRDMRMGADGPGSSQQARTGDP